MVESTATQTRDQINQGLVNTAKAMFAKAESLPVVIEHEEGNVTVR